MPSPFPGMNPYLENPIFWQEIHHRLITAIADDLAPKLRPNYIVAIDVRLHEVNDEDSMLVGIPDVTIGRSATVTTNSLKSVAVVEPQTEPITVELPITLTVKQAYLEIRGVKSKEVITAIEILSPVNKRTGEGREKYEKKRQTILSSLTHFIEIDLLRSGQPLPILNNPVETDYRILVSRAERRPLADLYAFNLQQPIPKFPLSLRPGDNEPLIDLQELLHGIYDRAGFDLKIDYTQEVLPSLSEEHTAWVKHLLQEQGLVEKVED